jgi:hypothetical protein
MYTKHVPKLNVAMRCVLSSDLSVMLSFTRLHDQLCTCSIPWSDEDNRPYCRYAVHTSESGIGENVYARCLECGECSYVGSGLNT